MVEGLAVIGGNIKDWFAIGATREHAIKLDADSTPFPVDGADPEEYRLVVDRWIADLAQVLAHWRTCFGGLSCGRAGRIAT